MKKLILSIGLLFSMLMTLPSYAQKSPIEKKENNNKTKRVEKKTSQKMEAVTPKQKERISPNLKRLPNAVKEPQRVNQDGHIDPITGEWITPPSKEGSFVSITSPKSNLSVGEAMNGRIMVKGRTMERHKVEIRVQSGTEDATTYTNPDPYLSKIIEDWQPVTVRANGDWYTEINVGPLTYSAGADWDGDEQHYFTILARDKSDTTKIEVLHLTRLKPKND